jgi:hypothetical protein
VLKFGLPPKTFCISSVGSVGVFLMNVFAKVRRSWFVLFFPQSGKYNLKGGFKFVTTVGVIIAVMKVNSVILQFYI